MDSASYTDSPLVLAEGNGKGKSTEAWVSTAGRSGSMAEVNGRLDGDFVGGRCSITAVVDWLGVTTTTAAAK